MTKQQDENFRRVSVKQLNGILKPFRPMRCWDVGLAYGSVVRFEMGEKIGKKTLKGDEYFVGSTSFWLYADVWRIYEHGVEIVNSDTVSREFVENALRQKNIEKCIGMFSQDRKSKALSVSIVRGVKIVILPKMIEMDERDDFIHLFLPDGQIVGWSEKRGLYVTKETTERAPKTRKFRGRVT